MASDLPNPDQALLNRYFETVLIRYKDGRYDLQMARLELDRTFALSMRSQSALHDHVQAIVDAGDDA